MKLTLCTLLSLPLLSYLPQERDKWQRLFTYEESTVDIDASNIIFGADFTGRVRFRITFSSPQKASDAEKVEYKRAIETIEFKCPQSQYRVVNLKRFDNKGREVGSNEAKPSLEWKQVKPRTLMERFFKSGCEVINRKKQNP